MRAGRGGGGLFNDENEDCQGVARVRKQKLNLCFLFFSFFNLTVSYHMPVYSTGLSKSFVCISQLYPGSIDLRLMIANLPNQIRPVVKIDKLHVISQPLTKRSACNILDFIKETFAYEGACRPGWA